MQSFILHILTVPSSRVQLFGNIRQVASKFTYCRDFGRDVAWRDEGVAADKFIDKDAGVVGFKSNVEGEGD